MLSVYLNRALQLHSAIQLHSVLRLQTALTSARATRRVILAASYLALCACGGTQKAAEAPETVEPTSNEGANEEPNPKEPSSDEASEPDSATESDDALSARDTLIREGTAFILNFEKSDIGIEEKEKCEKRSGGDIAKEANCFATAMNKYPREGILFETSGDDWLYVRFGLIKNARVDFNKVKVEIAEPSDKQVVLTPTGPDKGSRRKGAVPKKLEFTVVDEYTIELVDPNRGKLVYEPKLGLFAAE